MRWRPAPLSWRLARDSSQAILRVGRCLLLAWTPGVFLAGLLPTELQEAPRTIGGQVHDIAALVAILSLPCAAAILARRAPTTAPHVVQWLARLTVIALLSRGICGSPGLAGLGQRVAIGTDLAWLLVLALQLRPHGSSKLTYLMSGVFAPGRKRAVA